MFIGIGIGMTMGMGRAAGDGPPVDPLPTLTVTGGTITPFARGGVDYVEVLWRQGGSFEVSDQIDAHIALAAGAGAGGLSNIGWTAGGGGAGGLYDAIRTLAAGIHTVSIGAGAPSTATVGATSSGSDSSLTMPDGTVTVTGGGKGGSVGSIAGLPGGSGGGASAGGGGPFVGGAGTAGQGFNGGDSFGGVNTLRSGGGGGGAGGVGAAGQSGIGGAGGAGRLLDWIATPRTVCRGGAGTVGVTEVSSPDEDWSNGSSGAYTLGAASVGKGGDGFLFLVVRADQVNVEMVV
ncbi:hypothetical protein PE067_08365 [Paracoccus sp. DMF-8]|uniref:glycine-rich domain-containing protein n=1 Tax=Paracoccus sp. DMF-8 TaxID=3019445 RepID=UPI0023E7EE44|nr:hypothetical protein [Paracoccus sp. DMF-8]MDF3606140.1 hypothetical protein [Paracoccus sp. DMF-8]